MDSVNLERFVEAQEPVYSQVLVELRRGRKESHWMWFIFPQLAGLGRSRMAHYYGIGSLAEAAAYLSHPLLGPRLAECTDALLAHAGSSAAAILGAVDAVKLRSSMTLFAKVPGASNCFARCLSVFFSGDEDSSTLALIAAQEP